MQFDIVVPTRGNISHLKTLLACIEKQSLRPQRIIFVVNQYHWSLLQLQWEVSKDVSDDLYDCIDWHIISADDPMSGNASFARNVWCSLALSDYVYFIDDDNQFWPDFFTRTVAEYLSLRQEYKSELLYSPTIMRRDTERVQSQWIKAYHYIAGRPEPVIFGWWKSKLVSKLRPLFALPSFYKNRADYVIASTIWGNSLFSKRSLFQAYPFDVRMAFVYEDIDMAYRITKHGIPLIISKKLHINHMERTKNPLEQSFLATTSTAFQKSKNRILFVKKNGALWQKIIFFVIWLPITTVLTCVFVVVRGWKKSLSLLSSYCKGIYAWLVQ